MVLRAINERFRTAVHEMSGTELFLVFMNLFFLVLLAVGVWDRSKLDNQLLEEVRYNRVVSRELQAQIGAHCGARTGEHKATGEPEGVR